MKSFGLFGAALAAKDACLPLNENDNAPNYGGTCWNVWGSAADVESWAADNCGANTCTWPQINSKDCFSNPFDNPTDIKDLLLDYDEWAANYVLENERPDFTDPYEFPECNVDGESVFKPYAEWFGAEVTGCDFKIQLTSEYFSDAGLDDRATQTTSFYSGKKDDNVCGDPNYGSSSDLSKCYCDLEESSPWIAISNNPKFSHPINPRIARNAERSNPDVIDIEISQLSAINNNMNDELKIVKNHANRNAWRMDCLYCAMMDIKNEVLVQTYYYEFILEQYNLYTEKLMHYTCNAYYQEQILSSIQERFDELTASIEINVNYCNGDNELCFEGDNCEETFCQA